MLSSLLTRNLEVFSPHRAMIDFGSFMGDNNLLDIVPQNGLFTWTKRRSRFLYITVRLDQFLISQNWKLLDFTIQSEILPLLGSDHFPIQLQVSFNKDKGMHKHKPSFKFESMWLRHPQILPLLKFWWLNSPLEGGTRMFKFHKKL